MFAYLQKIGKALMVPVAVLPLASLLLGIGYWIDPTGWGGNSILAALLIKAGASVLDNMGILFAVGVAYGMSKDRDGAAALAGLVAWLVITTLLSAGMVAQIMGHELSGVDTIAFQKINNTFIGILCGVIASGLYNKFSKIELNQAFAFFSGRRFVPILTSIVMIPVSFILMYIWPIIFGALVTFGEFIQSMGAVGAGIYGIFNRLLIPVGLHHALNQVFWFNIAGINDIPNFLGGAKSIADGVGIVGKTGMYQAGYFPIMMFGLLGAGCAFIKTAKSENKNKIKSIVIAAGLSCFISGVTEPMEFAFMFVAPGLFLVHAILTGISVFLAAQMQWIAGFGFSAGAIDLILSARNPLAVKWGMLVVQGIVFFFLYYFIFVFAINKFNLKTPGREIDTDVADTTESTLQNKHAVVAEKLLKALGGKENIISVDYCATRLRLEVKDSSIVDDNTIKKLASGILKPSKTSVQIIVGTYVEFVATELKVLI